MVNGQRLARRNPTAADLISFSSNFRSIRIANSGFVPPSRFGRKNFASEWPATCCAMTEQKNRYGPPPAPFSRAYDRCGVTRNTTGFFFQFFFSRFQTLYTFYPLTYRSRPLLLLSSSSLLLRSWLSSGIRSLPTPPSLRRHRVVRCVSHCPDLHRRITRVLCGRCEEITRTFRTRPKDGLHFTTTFNLVLST